ncbi:hypothetical protein C8J28_1344 [Cereibacter azotoformans]|uniref:Uncharacterized protein n=2 Tax=Cereibacter azotoformans TaxID=43057 RepID=A0A2T5JNE8_9RHOB|nr:hypothetical protein C8J28_1344 [Cereibacter azotoformans]
MDSGFFEPSFSAYWNSNDTVERIIPSNFDWAFVYSDRLTDTGIYFYDIVGGEAVLRARRPLFAGPMLLGTHFDLVTISRSEAMDQIRALYDAPAQLDFTDDFWAGSVATHITLLDAFYENFVDLDAYWDDPALAGAMRGGTTTLVLEDVGIPYMTDMDVHLSVTCNGAPVDTSSVRLDMSSHRKSTTGASRRAGSARLTYGLEPGGSCALKNGW